MNYASHDSDDSSFRTEMSVFCAGKDFSFMAPSSYFLLNEKNLPSYLERLRKYISILPDLSRSTGDQQLYVYIVAYMNSVCTMYCENMWRLYDMVVPAICFLQGRRQPPWLRKLQLPTRRARMLFRQVPKKHLEVSMSGWRIPKKTSSLLVPPFSAIHAYSFVYTSRAPKDCGQFLFASKQHRNLFVQLFARTSIK